MIQEEQTRQGLHELIDEWFSLYEKISTLCGRLVEERIAVRSTQLAISDASIDEQKAWDKIQAVRKES
jgi:hypothetical protein